MQGADLRFMEFPFSVQLHCQRLLLKAHCEANEVRLTAAIYKCPTLSFLSPLPLLVTSYHCQRPAAVFTLGAVTEMCHHDVMLHTLGDKTASRYSHMWRQ